MLIRSDKCVGGGNCEACGKCNRYDTTTRKKKLTYLPEDFKPDSEAPVDPEDVRYGMAVDIGTTTVVGMLWNLNTNELVDMIAKTNPQSTYGADVISRITYSSESEKKLTLMKEKIRDCLNGMIDELERLYGIDPNKIVRAAVVGNTTMSHLFLGINASSLARSPFAPAFTGPVQKTAEEMGLRMRKGAMIYLLPNIAGHVGSDIVGVLLASGLKKLPGLRLVIDVGTNGEMVLAHNGRMLACSTAAGPAFEGASIHQGMRAAKGSIERVTIENGQVEIQVIEHAEPIGICGSGLIDAVAQMLDAGILTFKGNIIDAAEAASKGLPEGLVKRLRRGPDGNEFVLAEKEQGEDIVITQKDIREVQLAKAAIYAGSDILLKCMEMESSQLEEIMLAGAFGSYISKKSALRIGLIPNIGEEKVSHIGNAAGVGACMALLSRQEREQSALQHQEVEHVELALHENFEREYLKAMYFPK